MQEIGLAKGYIELDLSSLETSVKSATAQLDKIEASGKLAQSEIRALESASRGVSGVFEAAAAKAKTLAAGIETAKQKAQVYRTEISGLNAIIEKCKSQQGELATKINEAKKAHEDANEKVKSLADSYKAAQKEIKAASKAYGEDSAEAQKAAEKHKDLIKSYEDAVRASKDNESALTSLQAQYDALGKEIDESGDQVVKFQTDLNNTEADLREMSAELADAQSTAKNFGTAMQEAGEKMRSIGDAVSDVGAKLTAGITAPITAAATASAKWAIDAESSYAKVATIADETVLSYEKMKTGVQEASNETGVAVTDLNEALYSSISAGVDSGSAIAFTTDMVKLAKGGFTDTAKAVDVVTSVLNAYGLEAEDASAVSDRLITTQNVGKTTVDELASSMGRLIPTAKAASVDFDNVSAGMAILTKRGIQTAEATTYFSGMLNELSKSGSVADKALTEMANKGFSELIEEGTPLTEVLSMLSTYAEDSGKSLKDMFGSAEAGKAALSIMSDGGEEFNAVLQQMQSSAGATQSAFDKIDATPAERMNKIMNRIKNDGIEIGEKLLPIAEKAMDKVEDLLEWFDRLSDAEQEQVLRMAGIAAATGPVLTAGGKVISGLGGIVELAGKTAQQAHTFSGVAGQIATDAEVAAAAAANTTGAFSGLSGVLYSIAGVAGPAVLAGAAIAGIAYACEAAYKAAVEYDLQEHFGNLKLSAEEVESVAERLTSRDWTIRLDAAIDAKAQLEEFEKQISDTMESINKRSWMVSAGIELNDQEMSEFRSDLESFIAQTQAWVQQQHYTATLSIQAIMGEDSAYIDYADSVYSGLEAEMSALGGHLADLVNDAWEDGVLSSDEMKVIDEARARIQEKIKELEDARYQVEMEDIVADAKNGDISAESFTDLQNALNEKIEERKQAVEQAKVEALVPFKVKLNEDSNYNEGNYEFDKQQIELKAAEELGTLVLDNIEYEIQVISGHYDNATKSSAQNFTRDLKSTFQKEVGELASGDINFNTFFDRLTSELELGADSMSPAEKGAVQKLLEQMKPQAQQLEEIAAQYRAAGQSVPEEIAAGLSDYNTLLAMTGNVDAGYALLAQQISESEELQSGISAARAAGQQIPPALAAALEENYGLVFDAAGRMLTTADEGTQAVYPSVYAALQGLGMTLPDGIATSLMENQSVGDAALAMLNQIANGVALSEPQLTALLNACGINCSSSLIDSIADKEPDVQTEAIELLSQIQYADGKKREEILAQMEDLGIDVSEYLGGSMTDHSDNVADGANDLINTADDTLTDGVNNTIGPNLSDNMEEVTERAMDDASRVAGSSELEGPTVNEPYWRDAVSEAHSDMQSWLDRHPIIATVKQFVERIFNGYAEGGLVDQEQLAWVAEGNSPEMIIPLSASKRSRALSLYAQAGAALGVNTTTFKHYNPVTKSETIIEESGGIDYDRLAQKIGAVLQTQPQPEVSLTVTEGDVILNGEKVGRALAPTVSRVLSNSYGRS